MPRRTTAAPLEPFPAERTSQRRLSFTSAFHRLRASHLGTRGKGEHEVRGTRSTYAWRWASKNSRSWVQLP